MTNVIPVRFSQAPAVRCISRESNAQVMDFCAYRAARLVDSDDLFAIACAIERRVMELRQMIEAQTFSFEGVARDE